MNPYLNRVMIRDPADFFGRKRELARLYARINAPRPQSVSIIGERRIGKSSLLAFLAHPENRGSRLREPERTVLLFLDFQENREMEVEDFFRAVSSRLREQLPDTPSSAEGRGYNELLETVRWMDERGLKLILLLDEFEVVTQNSNFDAKFFAFLRSLANRYNVAYITTSRKPLQELCHTKQISDSPFFNIFTTLHLGPFSLDEAMELIKVPSERVGVPLESYSDFLMEIAGTFPFFLQIACSALFEYLQMGGELDQIGRDGVIETFLEEAEPHFRYIWDRLDDAQRQVCLRVARGEPISPRDLGVLRRLRQQGYVIMESGETKLFSSVFAEQVEILGEAEPEGEGEVVDYAPEAIVVIDICGSTEICDRYGAHLLRSLYKQLEGIAFEAARQFNDRYRRSTGDGVLLTFSSVRDAINASLEIQRRVQAYNTVTDKTHRIPIRFSVHFGETLTDERGNRFGDAVNMAFRVASLRGEEDFPTEDYILITERVYHELESLPLPSTRCIELGVFEIRGFTGLHRIYRLMRG
jgi:class 3 adenylate cyclase